MPDTRSTRSLPSVDSSPAPATRSALRAVAVPTEHGGWGLTLEPIALGLLIAPSTAGLLLGLAALLGFLVRTPLKFVLVDRRRHRHLERTRTAEHVAMVEVLVIAALVTGAVLNAGAAFWWPALVAAPLIVTGFVYDARSRSRRLIPELAGSIGIAAIAAMILLADGATAALSGAIWLVLAARCATSIPFVRDEIARLHDRAPAGGAWLIGDLSAIVLAVGAALLEPEVLAGSLTVLGIVAFQRLPLARHASRAAMVGAQQIVLGLTLVLVTALGVLAP